MVFVPSLLLRDLF